MLKKKELLLITRNGIEEFKNPAFAQAWVTFMSSDREYRLFFQSDKTMLEVENTLNSLYALKAIGADSLDLTHGLFEEKKEEVLYLSITAGVSLSSLIAVISKHFPGRFLIRITVPVSTCAAYFVPALRTLHYLEPETPTYKIVSKVSGKSRKNTSKPIHPAAKGYHPGRR